MNLSHSAAVLFYELSQTGEAGRSRVEMASGESLSLLEENTRSLLLEVCYPEYKVEFTLLMLRRILGRAELTEREARTLLGLIKKVRWRIGRDGDENQAPRDENEMREKSSS